MQDIQQLLLYLTVFIGFTILIRTVMGAGVKRVSGAEAKQLVAGGALLVDVRSPAEFSSGKIKGAKNIPLQDLERRMQEFGSKDRPVILYCASGARSAMAGRKLKAAGYDARNLGSLRNWPA